LFPGLLVEQKTILLYPTATGYCLRTVSHWDVCYEQFLLLY